MNYKRPASWLQALIVTITLTAVAAVVFLGSKTHSVTEMIATEQFNRQQLILARSAAAGIEAYYRELSEALSSLAKLPGIQRMSPESLYCMQHTYWGFPPRTSIRLLDGKGILRFIYPFESWRGELIGRNYGEKAYFREAEKTGRISVSGMIINEQSVRRFRIAVPVYLTHKKESVRVGDGKGIIVAPIDTGKPEANGFQGALVGSFDPYIFAKDFISPIVSGNTGYAWLLNEDGIFLAHYEEGFTARNVFEVREERNPDVSYEAVEQIQRRMMAGEEGTGRYISGWHRGQRGRIEKLIAYTPVHIGSHIWSVAVCAPVNEVEQIIRITRRSERYTLALVLLAVIAGGLFSFIISYRWSHFLAREVANKTKELRETSDYLNNLIKYANAPIIVWSQDKRVTIFNKAFERLSGLSEAEIIGQPLDMLFPEESRSDSLQKIEQASKGEFWENVELPVLGKDGETRIGLWNSANIYAEDGKTLIATVAQGQDITARKRTEERLILFSLAIEQSTEGIAVVDLEGYLLFVNNAFARMHGYTPEELTGRNLSVFHTSEQIPSVETANRQIRETGEFSGEIWHVHRDGTVFPTLMHNSLLRDEKGNPFGIICTLRNITERKKLEDQLRQAQKMEAIGTLAGGIAHDFNNILAAVIGYTQLALEDVAKNTPLYEDLQEVLKAGNRAKDLVMQILTFSHRHEQEKKPIRVSPIVKEALKLLRSTLPSSIEIRQQINPELGNVLADPTQVHQILINLCTNASHAMQEKGGVLGVSLSQEALDSDFVSQYPDLAPGAYLSLKVSDTGHGMEPELLERIFDPYFTTKEKDKGTGLGLAVVHGIVKNHSGLITVFSDREKGTTFTVYLPVIERIAAPETSGVKPLPTGSELILFIDDEQVLVDLGKRMIENLGYRVITRRSSVEALELFRSDPQRFDLVITDMTMPGMTGDKLAKELLRIRPDIPIIICTGFSEKITEERAGTIGVRALIMKPMLKADIAGTVRRVLDQGSSNPDMNRIKPGDHSQ